MVRFRAATNTRNAGSFYWHYKTRTALAWLLLLSFLPLATGCNYYRAREKEEAANTVTGELAAGKRFILHQGQETWELRTPVVKEQALEGTLTPVPDELVRYLHPKPGEPNRYLSRDKYTALNLVHLYVYEFAHIQENRVHIPVAAIKKITIADKDSGATIASHALGVTGSIAGAFSILAIIVALTKSSCPYVYAYNGSHFAFTGETYGGAIFSPLERHDYMPLPQLKRNGEGYQVKIANELKERQYTNLAELLVVHHPEQVRVLLDQQGSPHTIGQLQQPEAATGADGLDYASQLFATDSSAYLFNHAHTEVNSLHLRFNKPTGARTAKLVLHARNSLWLDYIYGEFMALFGSFYTTWASQQKKVPAAQHEQWQQEQAIPLLIEVKTTKGWIQVAQLPTVGPLAGRNFVLPIDLSKVPSETLELRLTSGFMFWELDLAGVDFSENLPVTRTTVKAASATSKQGREVQQLLATDDNRYLQQFTVGDEVLLSFPVPPALPGTTQSSFLHTKGYYEHIRDFEGLPQLSRLQEFKHPGHFTRFSRDRYQQVIKVNNLQLLTHATTATP